MAYVYPNPQAADVSFSGDAPYVYPDPQAADVSFVDGGVEPHTLTMQGFMPVRFGTPVVGPIPEPTQLTIQGWRITNFGRPSIPSLQELTMRGFAPVRFGYPIVLRINRPRRGRHLHFATLRPVKFGTPQF